MEYELSLFIIWEKARQKTDNLLEEIEKKFEIRDIYEIIWNPENFSNNLKRFYGANLPKPLRKTLDCGTGPFLLILVIDPNPKYGKRRTSNGMQLVNTNIYDSKMIYRRMLGGGYPIHSAINKKEVNHDLTLLLNKNLDEILNSLPKQWNREFKIVKADLVGTNGWKNFKELFLVLNSTTNYVILRNFEHLPDRFDSKIHKDVDLLTDDFWQAPYLLNQRKQIDDEILVSPTVKIGNQDILFDIKYVGDKYYDERWSKNILKNRVMTTGGFYIPCLEDQFYSLLYHMIIHKLKLSNDYIDKLSSLANELRIDNISAETFSNFDKLKEILEKYMKKMGYNYTDSFEYKIKHNEFTRLANVAILTMKNEGTSTLFRAIKGKLRRKIKGKSRHDP